MKNIVKIVSVVLFAALLMTALVSCGDKSGAIKSAFEKAGYTVKEVKGDSDEAKSLFSVLGLSDEQKKNAANYGVMIATKEGDSILSSITGALSTALVIKFSNDGEVKDFYAVETKDGSKDYSAYDSAVESGLVNGNCVCFSASSDSIKIFKEA